MGAARFTYGFLKLAIVGKTYPCDIAVKVEIDHKDEIKEHYRQRQKRAGSLTPDSLDSKYVNARQSKGPSTAPSSPEDSDKNGSGQGLPPLQHGTVMDELPDGWELVPHEKLGNFYCGNVRLRARIASLSRTPADK